MPYRVPTAEFGDRPWIDSERCAITLSICVQEQLELAMGGGGAWVLSACLSGLVARHHKQARSEEIDKLCGVTTIDRGGGQAEGELVVVGSLGPLSIFHRAWFEVYLGS